MSNSRMLSAFFAAGLLTMLAFFGLGCQKPSLESELRRDLELANQNLRLSHGLMGGSGTNSPLKVRGGSMTVRTIDKWTSVSSSPPSFCTNADTSYIALVGVTPTSAAPSGPIPLALANIPPIPNVRAWHIDIFGRDPNTQGKASTNGIALDPQSSSCSGTPNKMSVKLSVQPGGNSSFYASPVSPDDDNTHSQRFEDTTSDPNPPNGKFGCQGPVPNASSSVPNGDKDLCERISSIVLTLDPDNTKKPVYAYQCPNGECSISIGQQ